MIIESYIYRKNLVDTYPYAGLWEAIGGTIEAIATTVLKVTLGTITTNFDIPSAMQTIKLWVTLGAHGNSEVGIGGINGHRRFVGPLKTRGIHN